MLAYTKYRYGGPEVLQLEQVDRPTIAKNQLLVKIKANSANPADWHILRGAPFIARLSFGLFKPRINLFGGDFAGEVVEVGDQVSQFKVGDRVFGENTNWSSFAEYALVPAETCAKIPGNLPYDKMAAVPIAGLTAYQAIVTHGKVKPNESVLINGASGGVGHLAVQIAKAHGAHVTGVSSSRNIDFVKSLGADAAIAYDKESIHEHSNSYDLILDTNGNLTFDDFKRMGKRAVLIGFTSMGLMMKTMIRSAFSKFSLTQFTAQVNEKDLNVLAGMVEDGTLEPRIEKTYPYDQIPEAISYIEQMRTRGKVVMLWP